MSIISLRTAAAASLLAMSILASAQIIIVRPEETPSKPKVTPVAITQAPAKMQEARTNKERRSKARMRRTSTAPKPVVYAPVEFTANTSDAPEHPVIDLASFAGPKPESKVQLIEQAAMLTLPVGNFAVNIPECITVTDQGSDFVSGALENLLEFDSWQFDPTYKLSTPQAYTRYITQLYGGVERTATEGNRTDIDGYDTQSSRNYHVTLIADGDKLHVTRILYRPALERPVTRRMIPQLIATTPATTTATP